jgi:signal transduction histidine kinase
MDMSSDAACIRETTEIIKCEVKQLTNLVDDLLDVTRIVTNRVVLRKEIVCLNDICLSRANAFKLLYTNKRIDLEISVTDDPVCIEADPVRIHQIIGNLLHNALKFTEEGKGYVRFDMHVENREAVLCVSDNGIGIEPQIMPMIYEPFVQGQSVLDRASCGLGLGLPIIKSMTELHGGRVHACSAGPHCGSSFFIYLPLIATDVPNC